MFLSMRTVFAVLASIALVGCGTIGNPFDPRIKMSSPFVTKVIEGEVVKVDTKANPRLKKPEISTTDVVITHAQANNINNSKTTGRLLALDIALDVINHEPDNVMFYTIKDYKTGDNIDILRSSMYGLGKFDASIGDKFRLIYGANGLLAVYNITANPELDAKTR